MLTHSSASSASSYNTGSLLLGAHNNNDLSLSGGSLPDRQSNSSPSSSSSSASSLSSDSSSSDADPVLLLFDYLFDSDNSHQDYRNNIPAEPPPRPEKRRRGAKGVAFYVDETGVRRVLPPRMSSWYSMYIENADIENNGFKKKFRRRFRMPYPSFVELVNLTKASVLFQRWSDNNHDAAGKKTAPIELLVLAALRYLGRGWTFDDLSESTAISEEVIRCFFHRFIQFGSTDLFDRWVVQPTVNEQANSQTHEFAQAGLPGAIGSMDATHVVLERVNYKLRQSHLGHKLSCTARTYNIVCNHRRRILSTTEGHPARWNDKSIVKFDPFVMGIKEGTTTTAILVPIIMLLVNLLVFSYFLLPFFFLILLGNPHQVQCFKTSNFSCTTMTPMVPL